MAIFNILIFRSSWLIHNVIKAVVKRFGGDEQIKFGDEMDTVLHTYVGLAPVADIPPPADGWKLCYKCQCMGISRLATRWEPTQGDNKQPRDRRSCVDHAPIDGSWEKIQDAGDHPLSSLLPWVLIVVVAILAMRSAKLSQHCFVELICPLTDFAKRFLAWFDLDLFLYHKSQLDQSCSKEDSFWRLSRDAWVRGLDRCNDSTYGVFMNAKDGYLFMTVAALITVPLVSFGVSLILNIVFVFELRCPYGSHFVSKRLGLESLSLIFNPFADWEEQNPVTEPRLKAAVDDMDWFLYWRDRAFKRYQYYYSKCVVLIGKVIVCIMIAVVVVRLALIWLNMGALVGQKCTSHWTENYFWFVLEIISRKLTGNTPWELAVSKMTMGLACVVVTDALFLSFCARLVLQRRGHTRPLLCLADCIWKWFKDQMGRHV